MFCKYCGSELSDDAGFCQKCGNALTGVVTQQQSFGEPCEVEINKKSGMEIASLVLGIIGLIVWFIPLLGSVVGVLGLIFGIVGVKKGGKGMAIAGIVLASFCLLACAARTAFIFLALIFEF